MGQESTLVEGAKRLYSNFTDAVNKIPTPGHKPKERKVDDTHAKMVAEANESFRKSAAKKKRAYTK